ncbi:hypothetical protein Pfo_025825, partial [Paulownia fortunei]
RKDGGVRAVEEWKRTVEYRLRGGSCATVAAVEECVVVQAPTDRSGGGGSGR